MQDLGNIFHFMNYFLQTYNWYRFLLDRIIGLLYEFNLHPSTERHGSTSPLGDVSSAQLGSTLESLLYLSGALKFLTASPITQDLFCVPKTAIQLATIHEALETFSGELDSRLESGTSKETWLECEKISENVYHVLLQASLFSNVVFELKAY